MIRRVTKRSPILDLDGSAVEDQRRERKVESAVAAVSFALPLVPREPHNAVYESIYTRGASAWENGLDDSVLPGPASRSTMRRLGVCSEIRAPGDEGAWGWWDDMDGG